MSPRVAKRVAATTLAVSGVSLGLGIVLFALNRGAGHTTGVFSYSNLAQNLPATVAFLGMGALLVSRRPGNAIGWLCLANGFLAAVGGVLAQQYAAYVLVTHPGSLFGGGLALAVPLNGAFAPPLVLLIFIPLIFPTGHLLSRRWRYVAWMTVISFATLFAVAITTTPLDSPFQHYENPIGIRGGLNVVPWLAVLGGIASVVAALTAVVIHYRRSRGDERAQVKWLVLAAAFLPASVIAHTLAEGFAPAAVGTIEGLFSVVIMAFPIAIGIAILKYRLYEIDRLISRTLSYLTITGILAGVFIGIVLFATRVLPFSSPVGVAASTLAAAALFNPLRVRVQRLVDRRFNRARYDAEATVAAFGARLRDSIDVDAVLAELSSVAARSLEPAHVTVWVPNDPGNAPL